MKIKTIIIGILIIIMSTLVLAGPYRMDENLEMGTNDIYNATNINSTNFFQDGNKVLDVTDVNGTNFNYSLYANSSTYWDSETSQADLNVNSSTTTTFWASVSSFIARWFYDESNVLTFNETLLNDTIDARSDFDTRWDVDGTWIYNNSGNLSFNTTSGDNRYYTQTAADSQFIEDSTEGDLNVNSSTYWDGETSQSNLNVNHSNSTTYWDSEISQSYLNVNSSNYWDALNTPADILISDLDQTGETSLNVNSSTWWALLDSWSSTMFENVAGELGIKISWFNSSSDARIDIAEPNLNVNSSDYWDGLNTTLDIGTDDITDDGTWILSSDESDLNVNYSDTSGNANTVTNGVYTTDFPLNQNTTGIAAYATSWDGEISQADLNVNSSTYWDGETSQANLSVYNSILFNEYSYLNFLMYSSFNVWVSDSSIVSGLGDVGSRTSPTVFLDGSTWKLISGEYAGDFYGYYWNNTSWINDSSIVSGLVDIGDYSSPIVFLDDGVLKLISGEDSGDFNGYYWNGSTWVSNSSIVSGLVDIDSRSSPTVFLDGSTWKLISGEYAGDFNGYYWNGSTWVSDSSIVSGLVDIGSRSSPTVFLDGSTWKLISGEYVGDFYGYYWSGSTWINDSSIVSGLGDVGTYSSPTVFLDDGVLKLISGESSGVFNGYLRDNGGIDVGIINTGQGDNEVYAMDQNVTTTSNVEYLTVVSNNFTGDLIGNVTGNADTATDSDAWITMTNLQSKWLSDLSNVLTFDEAELNTTIDARSINTAVTSIATTAPITGGTITSTGTIALDTATPSDGDTIHASTADQIYDWVIGLGYSTTDTTYSAGNGISLSTTTFSVAGNTALTQDADGLSVTAGGIGDTQISDAYINQTLTTTSNPTFNNQTITDCIIFSSGGKICSGD